MTVDDVVTLGRELKRLGVDDLVPSIELLNSQFAAPETEPGDMVHLRRDAKSG